ncbi:MBL fold metallo-hydrolase [uncultured Microbacterium sp.]|uniref:MBL fold metallo-hydrolase n=1 Tax=uncultured Microbacterium sp. TaxID=191216 RepID=UPI0028D5351E|nr:MBL fold metallo-hydrolase [uncultured Microbacterium sp.]
MTAGSSWFAVQRLRKGVYLIAEPMHVNCYLIVGSRRAVLFDTGLGIARIRPQVEAITDLPVTVVNSHHHFDHVGGNVEFDAIAAHEAGVAYHHAGPPRWWLPAYLRCVDELKASYDEYESLDRRGFNLIAPEMRMRPFPPDFVPERWVITPPQPTQHLADGERLDLGGRALTVLHTPGHTPDSVCLLDEDNRILFSGDTVDTGPIYAHLPGADVPTYTETLRRMASQLTDDVDDILCAHGARYRTYPDVLKRVADAFDEVCSGAPIAFEEAHDCFMEPVREVRFDEFSIVLPPTGLEGRHYKPFQEADSGPGTCSIPPGATKC